MQRESLLHKLYDPRLLLSAFVSTGSWEELAERRAESRHRLMEGVTLNRRGSHYHVGRKRGDWWRWKIEPHNCPHFPPMIDVHTPGQRIEEWFSGLGWEPFSFQGDVWQHYHDGESGLIHAPTSTGKTYAAWLGPVMEWMAQQATPGLTRRQLFAYFGSRQGVPWRPMRRQRCGARSSRLTFRGRSSSAQATQAATTNNGSSSVRRQFREIARVAGLVFQGFPGQQRRAKRAQASSSLFYEVFNRYDPHNLLLAQAHREVLERQLERSRLSQTLARLIPSHVVQEFAPQPTPRFQLGERLGVLPALEEFTGMVQVPTHPGDRIFVLADGEVSPILR